MQCYPCHDSCRYCTGGSAYNCITCVDTYYLSPLLNVCVKLTCAPHQYVSSTSGCSPCAATYPHSLQCSSTAPTSCASGYMLQATACVGCAAVSGYHQVDGECKEVCGDGLLHEDSCDDGNN